MTVEERRHQQLEAAVADWIGDDPLLPDDTAEGLADEMLASDSRPFPDATAEELVPVMRAFIARHQSGPSRA